MKRVLVTGSRTWVDHEVISRALTDEYEPGATLIHGGAYGADSIAADIWFGLGGDVEVHIPDWGRHGKKAGYLRNLEMVDSGADICLAFIKNHSRGASMCAEFAETAGIPTRRFTC